MQGACFQKKPPQPIRLNNAYSDIAKTCFSFLCNTKRMWRTMYHTTSYIGISFSENSVIKSLVFFSGFLLCVAITSFYEMRKKLIWCNKTVLKFDYFSLKKTTTKNPWNQIYQVYSGIIIYDFFRIRNDSLNYTIGPLRIFNLKLNIIYSWEHKHHRGNSKKCQIK